MGKVLFSNQVALPSGQAVSGLLVYRTAELSTRTLRLEIQATTSTGEAVGFQLPYRFVKEKKPSKESER